MNRAHLLASNQEMWRVLAVVVPVSIIGLSVAPIRTAAAHVATPADNRYGVDADLARELDDVIEWSASPPIEHAVFDGRSLGNSVVKSSDPNRFIAPWPRRARVGIGQGPGGSFTHQKAIGAFDIWMPLGTRYLAVGRGVVSKVVTGCPSGVLGRNTNSRCGGGFGNHVVVEHRIVGADGAESPRLSRSGKPVFSLYGHMRSVAVRVGERVVPGTELGTCGLTGYTTGPHLHFQFQRSADETRRRDQLGLRDVTFDRGLEGAPAAMLSKAKR